MYQDNRVGASLALLLAIITGISPMGAPDQLFAAEKVVPTRDVENPARQPYQDLSGTDFDDGDFIKSVSLLPVPTGKILVVEFVSVIIQLPSAQRATANLNVQGGPHLYVNLSAQGSFGATDVLVGSQPVRLYVFSGNTPKLEVQRSLSTGFAGVNVSVVGYLVDQVAP